MIFAIHFYHQQFLQANKIYNISIYNVLSLELISQLLVSQYAPQCTFRFGRIMPHLSRMLFQQKILSPLCILIWFHNLTYPLPLQGGQGWVLYSPPL